MESHNLSHERLQQFRIDQLLKDNIKLNRYFFRADSADPSAPPSLHIRRVLLVSFGGIAFIVFLYGLFLVAKTWPIEEYSISKAGTFGDSFGALNSLFTGLGFAGLLTRRLQELSATRLLN